MKKHAKNEQGVIAVALTIVLLIFMVTAAGLVAVSAEHTSATDAYRREKALALAEAGLAKAAHSLAADPNYAGGKGELETGTYEISVERSRASSSKVLVTSRGFASTPGKGVVRKGVRAELDLSSPKFPRLVWWREL